MNAHKWVNKHTLHMHTHHTNESQARQHTPAILTPGSQSLQGVWGYGGWVGSLRFAGLAKLVSSRFNERHCVKKQGEEQSREMSNNDLWPPQHMSIYVQMHTHIHRNNTDLWGAHTSEPACILYSSFLSTEESNCLGVFTPPSPPRNPASEEDVGSAPSHTLSRVHRVR